MAVESYENNTAQSAPTGKTSDQKTQGFEGVQFQSAPGGVNDILSLGAAISVNMIDPSVEPYLKRVIDVVSSHLKDGEVSVIQLKTVTNSYVVKYVSPDGYLNFFGIQFYSQGDGIHPDFVPTAAKMQVILPELKQMFPDKHIRLVNGLVILSGYAPDMARADQMANTIVREFNVTTKGPIRDATIDVLKSNKLTVSWSLSEAEHLSQQLSPHGVPRRMEIALVLKARPATSPFGQDRTMREFETDAVPIGVIGGYTQIRQQVPVNVNNEVQMRWQPEFVITECNSILPIEGISQLLLAALAPAIYNSKYYLTQFTDVTGDKPNLGLLRENPERLGEPMKLKSRDEVLRFAEGLFANPVISWQIAEGRDAIPGTWRMVSENVGERQKFLDRVTNFLKIPNENAGMVGSMAVPFERRFEGVYGRHDGTLFDSRNVDYLFAANKLGWSAMTPDITRILQGVSNEKDRAILTERVVGNFTPLWLVSSAFVNPKYIDWLINSIKASGIQIDDPTMQIDTRQISSFITDFGSTANIGSIMTNGNLPRGMNVNGLWGS